MDGFIYVFWGVKINKSVAKKNKFIVINSVIDQYVVTCEDFMTTKTSVLSVFFWNFPSYFLLKGQKYVEI